MASTMVKTISVSDIAEMSDAELAEFMKRCRLPNGNYDLFVDDWHKLSQDERGRLARILEAKKRDLAASPTACSYSLDLDDLDARLRQVSPKGSFSSRPEPQVFERQRVPTPPIERHKFELRAYHQLLENGGRPLYPVSLIYNMHNDPDSYAEILLPWQEDFLDIRAEGIFERQLRRWQDFRKWQNDNRGCEDDDDGYPAYVEREKRLIKEDMTEEAGAELIAKIEADPLRLKTGWNLQQFLRSQDRRFNREHGCQGFHDYKAAVKRRLARYGFTQPFELDEDSKNQDKLTTWIEYLNYEYWWLDKYVSDIERLQPEHDRLWQALVNKNVLKPHETKEFVRTPESGMETQTAKNKALIAVQQAELKAKQIHKLTQEDPNRFDIPSDKRISMMKKSTENLLAAKRQLEQAKRRSHLIMQFVQDTFNYHGARRNAARHRRLMPWVLSQVPLIKSEMNLSNNNRTGPDRRRRIKRSRSIDEDPLEGQSLKKMRAGNERSPSIATGAPAIPQLDHVPLIESEVNLSKNNIPGPEGRRRTKRSQNTDEDPSEGQSSKKMRFDRAANERSPSIATEAPAITQLDHVPLTKSEANLSKNNRPGPEGRRRMKRSQNTDEDPSEGQCSKKMRVDRPANERSLSIATEAQAKPDQVPLIKSEVNLSKNNRPGPDGRRTIKSSQNIEDPLEGQSSKKMRADRAAHERSPSTATEAQAKSEHFLTRSPPQKDTQATLEGPRRSARVAERRDASMKVVKVISQPKSLSKSEATSAQPQASHSQIKSTKAPVARRQPPSNSSGGIAKPTGKAQRRRRKRPRGW